MLLAWLRHLTYFRAGSTASHTPLHYILDEDNNRWMLRPFLRPRELIVCLIIQYLLWLRLSLSLEQPQTVAVPMDLTDHDFDNESYGACSTFTNRLHHPIVVQVQQATWRNSSKPFRGWLQSTERTSALFGLLTRQSNAKLPVIGSATDSTPVVMPNFNALNEATISRMWQQLVPGNNFKFSIEESRIRLKRRYETNATAFTPSTCFNTRTCGYYITHRRNSCLAPCKAHSGAGVRGTADPHWSHSDC